MSVIRCLREEGNVNPVRSKTETFNGVNSGAMDVWELNS